MSEHKNVIVYGETANGELSSITTELLGCGRILADDLKEELICLFLGYEFGETPMKAIHYGADKVYQLSHKALKDYSGELYVNALEKVVNVLSPRIMLFGQDDIGKDLAPRLAFRLRVGLTMDCLELKINSESGRLEKDKPVYGGNVRAIYVTENFPQLATVRKKTMSPVEPDNNRKGEINNLDIEIDLSKIRVKIIDTVKEEKIGVKLEEAPVVVSGGRGIGSADGFKELYKLAQVMNGAVGASKHPCDYGWITDTAQIGLTGKIVAPELYIAVGISGATQHITGCSGSKNIIAINKDENANIFNYCRFGVIGDWKEVLPAFTERIEELLA